MSADDQAVIKLLYVNGVHALAQIARTWNLNYNGLSSVIHQQKWKEEKARVEVSIQQNVAEHTKFMQRAHHMMEAIHHGYEDLMVRHQLSDTFGDFPFDTYFAFLETYAKLVNSLGGVVPVSPDMHLHLQQNNLQQNLNLGVAAGQLMDGPAIASITDKNAKLMLRKVIENIVLTSKPPQLAEEVSAEVVRPEDKPEPARGKFR